MPGSRPRGCRGKDRYGAPRPSSAVGRRFPNDRLPRWPPSRPGSHPGHPVPRRPRTDGLLDRPLPGACAGHPVSGRPGAAWESPARGPTSGGPAILGGPTPRGADPSEERVQRLPPLAPLSSEMDGSGPAQSSGINFDRGWRLATNEKLGRTPRRGSTYLTTAREEHAQRHRPGDWHRGREEGEKTPWLERERRRGAPSERNIPPGTRSRNIQLYSSSLSCGGSSGQHSCIQRHSPGDPGGHSLMHISRSSSFQSIPVDRAHCKTSRWS